MPKFKGGGGKYKSKGGNPIVKVGKANSLGVGQINPRGAAKAPPGPLK